MVAGRPRVQLLGRDNGAGLSRDMDLLATALRDLGVDVHVLGLPHRGRFAIWRTRRQLRQQPPSFDLQIMLERIRREFFRAAKRNVLIPNPEYFDDSGLAGIDEVWCKTQHAEQIFAALLDPRLDARCFRIGFISPDRNDPTVPREHAFFHGPGRSNNKGTTALIALWAAHPAWPTLTVVWRRKRVELDDLPGNVRLIREHLTDHDYRVLQNRHRFHLCPSQTEGFGHYLVEAMSCAAVVVTLDAEPMNELVTAERGVLVPAHVAGRQDLATLYAFDQAAMTAAIERCIAMPESEAIALGSAARHWYEAECRAFPQRLAVALDQLPG